MKSVYVIGDSISMYYGPYLESSLHGVMSYARKEAQGDITLGLDNVGTANCKDSSHVLEFLKAKQTIDPIDCDLLLVNCGLHDIKTDINLDTKQVPIDLYQANLTEIIEVIRRMGLKMAWIRTTPCSDDVHNRPGIAYQRFASDCQAYNSVADQLMSDAGIAMIDLNTFTVNLGPNVYRDHVHFQDHICRQQAAFIAGWLFNWLNH